MGYFPPQRFTLSNGRECTIRTGVPSDAVLILEHMKRVAGESDQLLVTPEEVTLSEEEERAWIQQQADNPRHLLLVAEVDARIVGMLDFHGSPRKRLAHQGSFGISVQKRWQGFGIGRRLMETMIRWAEQHPTLEKVCLEVYATNEVAIQLYRNFGFQEEGRRHRQVKLDDSTYVDLIQMYKFVK
jgi:RimJ/RimL family protein N-acetyltransferase